MLGPCLPLLELQVLSHLEVLDLWLTYENCWKSVANTRFVVGIVRCQNWYRINYYRGLGGSGILVRPARGVYSLSQLFYAYRAVRQCELRGILGGDCSLGRLLHSLLLDRWAHLEHNHRLNPPHQLRPLVATQCGAPAHLPCPARAGCSRPHCNGQLLSPVRPCCVCPASPASLADADTQNTRICRSSSHC